MQQTIHSLVDLSPDNTAIISAIQADSHTVSRLHSTGFSKETEIRVIQNFGSGPIIVFVRGTEIALGRREAEKILVVPIEKKEGK